MIARNISRGAIFALLLILASFTASAQQAPETYSPEMRQKIFLKPVRVEEPIVPRTIAERKARPDTFLYPKPFGKWFKITTAMYWGGSLADTFSTGDLYESNSLFRREDGRLNKGKAIAATTVVYAGTLVIEKKLPLLANMLRGGLGIIRGLVAVSNCRKGGCRK